MADGIKIHVYGDYDNKDIARAQRDLQSLKTGAAGATPAMGGLNKAMLGLGAAAAGAVTIGAVVDFLKDAGAAAMEDQKSMVALAQAMDNVGAAPQVAQVEDFISSLMRATGTADDELRPAFQKLVTATGDVTHAQELLQTAMDVSAATGKDLNTVSLALAKASSGNVGALTKLGIPLDANIVKSKNFAAALEVVNEKFSGQAAAAAETYAGQMKRVTTAVDEAKEAIGYSLLNALQNTSNALGGTNGFVGDIAAAGELAAGMVTSIGQLTTAIAKLVPASNDADSATGGLMESLVGTGAAMTAAIPVFGGFVSGLTQVAVHGVNANNAQKALAEELQRSKVMSDAYSGALTTVGKDTRDLAYDTNSAKEEMEDLKAAIQGVNAAIDASQSLDDFRAMLRGLDGELKNNVRTLDGWGKGAKENRDVLRDAFADATRVVQSWVDSGKISADDFDKKFNGLARKIVKQFADDGFDSGDIKKWLGDQGIWSDPAVARVRKAAKDAAAIAAGATTSIGSQMAAGIAAGLDRDAKVAASMNRLVMEAKNAGKAAAEVNSPSKLTMREIGEPLAEGVATGIKNKTAEVAKSGADAVRETVKAMREQAVDDIKSAKAAIAAVSSGIVSDVLGNLNFQTTAADGTALTPEQIVQMFIGSTANQSAAVDAIAAGIGTKLPPELLSQILSMPPDTAIALANYLGANPMMLSTLTTNYAQLATDTETLLGVPMGKAWAMVGDQSAKEMLAAARALIKGRSESFTQFVANQLSTTVDVAVRFVGGGIEHRAMGGPVTAGKPYLVGENGPELFSPNISGGITPNHALGGGGGTTIVNNYIDVSGVVGDKYGLANDIRDLIATGVRQSGPLPSAWVA